MTVTDVVNRVNCELQRANSLAGGKLAAQHYWITVTLLLQVDDLAAITPSFSETALLNPATTSVVTVVSGNLSGARRRTFTTTYVVDASKFGNLGDASKCELPEEKLYSLSGDLGIPEIVSDGLAAKGEGGGIVVLPAKPADKTTPAAAAPTFGSQVQFIVTKSITGLGPNWVLKYFKGPSGSNGLLNGNRVDTDSVILTFAPQYVPPQSAKAAAAQAKATATAAAARRADEDVSAKQRNLAGVRSRRAPRTPGQPQVISSEEARAESELNVAQAKADRLHGQAEQAAADAAEVMAVEEAQSTVTAATSAIQSSKDMLTTILLQNLLSGH